VGVSEMALGTTEIELHRIDPVGVDLIWKYSPKKRDGKNEERRELFEAKYPHGKARIGIPESIEGVPLLVEEIQEVVGDRRRVDELEPLHGEARGEANAIEVNEGFLEGESRNRYIVHRHRERRLRKAKIEDVLRRTGRLACEVPGCEFDFKESYGKLGNGFAHVHHRIPFKMLKSVRNTKLDELAIVCANCHAMIHVGGKSREPDEVAPRKARSAPREEWTRRG
jgi:predicted HNH restriction endonuclease